MTLMSVVARVQDLQTQFSPTPAATTAASGRAFAAQLTAATGGTAVAGSPSGDAVVAAAKKYLGVPYVFGSVNPDKGLDCSGLVQRAYADLGIKVPRLSWEQAKAGTAVHGLANARPGDILGFSGNSHVAIYLGNNKMIAAPQPGEKVKIQDVYATPSAIRRVIPDAPIGGTGPVIRPAGLQATSGLAGVPYANLFTAAGAKYGVSPALLAAVAKVESGYNAKAVSPAGAQGLMQIMPATARELGVNPLDPAQAVDGAARLLSEHLETFDSLSLALAAYNAGGGAVRKYNGIPPYAETQAYVPKVRKAMAALG
jgi:soluble lytic murein transglycosylase-like protein